MRRHRLAGALSAICVLSLLAGTCAAGHRASFSHHLGRSLQQSAGPAAAPAAAPSSSADQGDDSAGCDTPWMIFNTTDELSFFAEALKSVGLDEATDSPYVTATFFAPTNDAFAALLHSFGTTQDQLLQDPSIVPILLYHMIPGQYILVSDMDLGDTLATAISENLTVGAAPAPPMAVPPPNATVVTIRSAQSIADIVSYNISACMAVVHEVDQVLVPQFLGVQAADGRVVYNLGDGGGSGVSTANFTLILPSATANVSDISDPVYQITDAGLMFSVSPAPV